MSLFYCQTGFVERFQTKLSVKIIENDGLEYQIFWMLWMVVKWEYCANQCFCWSKFRISVNHVSCQSTLHNSFKYFWGNIFSLKFSQIFCFSLRFLNNKYHFKLTIVSYDYFVAWHKIVKMYQTGNLLHVVKFLCLFPNFKLWHEKKSW